MSRNTLVLAGSAAVLSLLASPMLPAAGRGETARTAAAPSAGAAFEVAPAVRQEAAEVAEMAHEETWDDMTKLFRDVCAPAQKDADIKATGEAKRLQAQQEEVRSLCHLQPDDFIIAVLPDPLHTRLALYFDRMIEAVQQALQDEDYQFVRAVIPWDHQSHAEPPAFESRRAAEAYADAKAELPGLMAFRGAATEPGGGKRPLFVLIVGESPTAGVVTRQFRNAAQWIAATTGSGPPNQPALQILGPTFSGSLVSLAGLLSCGADQPCYGESRIFSGSVSNREAVNTFIEQQGHFKANLMSFQEASEVAIERFVQFLDDRGVDPKSIAILSEDETEYGGLQVPWRFQPPSNGPPASGFLQAACPLCPHLYFPREISRLRAAYQGLDVKDLAAGRHSAPGDLLPLNLEISGADDDTVPAFSKQMALSQEGVLLGIVSELRRHAIRFVVLRATDSLDLLFLSRYLVAAYPHGRIVTVGADILFPREVEDKQLHGILALSTYALTPAANHDFLNYARHGERVFPSSVEAGAYNAMRSLRACLAVEGPRPDLRYELETSGLVDLYQYGWSEAWRKRLSRDIVNTPPVHLLALGRDGYWPLAHLGPDRDMKLRTLLPVVRVRQFSKDPLRAVVPLYWKVAELAALLLAFGFAGCLLLSSVRSTSQLMLQLAPAAGEVRERLIAAAAFLLVCILALLVEPVAAGKSFWQLEDAAIWRTLSVAAAAAVLISAWLELFNREMLAAKHSKSRRRFRHLSSILCLLCILAIVLTVDACVWRSAAGRGGDTSTGHFTTLRSLQLTSGLSPALPLLLMAAAGLWWAFHTAAGSLLLDERRPRLPIGVQHGGALALAESDDLPPGPPPSQPAAEPGRASHERLNFAVMDLLRALPPRVSPLRLLLAALSCALWLFLGRRPPLMTLEDPALELLLAALFMITGAWIAGTTARLWEIWVKTRRLLVLLDSRPLRAGFKRLKGFTSTSLWRASLVTSMEFQGHLARVWEALGNVRRTAPDLMVGGIDSELKKVRDKWEMVLGPPDHRGLRHLLSNWWTRRDQEVELICCFGELQHATALAAGRALDSLAERWERDQRAGSNGKQAGDDPGARACEKFVCLVYVSFLLVVLMRIRSLTMAVAGMYIMVWVGINSYPFQPRATIAALSAILLVYMVGVAAVVFAQMNRDSVLSHLTDTNPGELGKDFWIRIGAFAALPLFSYLAAQFPQINHFLYSWLEPAVQALHK